MDLTHKIRICDNAQIEKATDICVKSKQLFNFASYYARQEFFESGLVLTYAELCYDLRTLVDSNNDTPFRRLPAAVSQQVLKQLATNWFAFGRATNEFFKSPNKFLGKPKPPKYIKDLNVISMDASRCFTIRNNKIHFTKGVLNPIYVPNRIRNRKIKLIRVVPHHNIFDLEFVYEVQEKPIDDTNTKTMSIDIGLDNFVTTTNDAGLVPFIINGKIIKSINQHYNKLKAKYQSELPKGKHTSRRIQRLGLRRQDQLKDQMHKISKAIVDYCVEYEIGTIIIGRNKGMKQDISLGKRVNQNFVSVPYYKFYNMLQYKCKLNGVTYIEIGEAYTSLCSYYDSEEIQKHQQYAGKRISRGQFQVSSGEIINADLNAAYNIHYLGTGVRIPVVYQHPVSFTVGARSINKMYSI